MFKTCELGIIAQLITRFYVDGFIINPIRNKRSIITIRPLPIHQNSIRHSEVLPIIERLPQVLQTGSRQGHSDGMLTHKQTEGS